MVIVSLSRTGSTVPAASTIGSGVGSGVGAAATGAAGAGSVVAGAGPTGVRGSPGRLGPADRVAGATAGGAAATRGIAGAASAGAAAAASAGVVETGAALAVAGEGVGAAVPGADALPWHATSPEASAEMSTRITGFMGRLPLSVLLVYDAGGERCPRAVTAVTGPRRFRRAPVTGVTNRPTPAARGWATGRRRQ